MLNWRNMQIFGDTERAMNFDRIYIYKISRSNTHRIKYSRDTKAAINATSTINNRCWNTRLITVPINETRPDAARCARCFLTSEYVAVKWYRQLHSDTTWYYASQVRLNESRHTMNRAQIYIIVIRYSM